LHTLPIESLTIDRSYVQCLNNSSCDVGLIPAIVSMAQAMQLHVIAEGIETLQQLKQLRTLHCDFGQGYLFAKPLTAEQATTLLRTDPHW
ncbi:MAG TPA: EAL domain-containing protein, partial [Allocoleopsis sp.]